MIRAAATLFVLLFAGEVRSETIDVKYRGSVDLKTFECRDIDRSSFIQRLLRQGAECAPQTDGSLNCNMEQTSVRRESGSKTLKDEVAKALVLLKTEKPLKPEQRAGSGNLNRAISGVSA